MLRASLCCVVVAVFSSPPAFGFENLDFEDTLLDVGSLPEFISNLPEVFDPAIVTPGWELRAEFLDGTPLSGYLVHGAMIDGHIGVTSQVVLSVNGRRRFSQGPALQGAHSLRLHGHLDGPPSEAPIPVAFQSGVVPSYARSILIQADESVDRFSIRFNGYPVEMTYLGHVAPTPGVDNTDLYPDNWEELNDLSESLGLPPAYPPPIPPNHGGRLFAGNISSIAGRVREMAIRPEPYQSTYTYMGEEFISNETPSILFDNVRFSSDLAPGPPVQVPEPAAGGLLLAGMGAAARRVRRRSPVGPQVI